MRRLMVVAGVFSTILVLTNCKPRQAAEDQSALRDAQLADLATLESFVAFKNGDLYEIKKCPKSATPGTPDQEAAKLYDAACQAKRGSGSTALSRFECNGATPYPPIPAPLYEAALKQLLQVENYEDLNNAAAAQQQESIAMRRQLEAAKEMVKELSGAEAGEVAAELEKGKKLVEQLELALNAKDIEVQKVSHNHTRYKNLLATLECGVDARKVYPTQDYLYLIRPFVGGRYETKVNNLAVNQLLLENQPYKHKTTFTITEDFPVGGLDIAFTTNHQYPQEIGIKVTPPSGTPQQTQRFTLVRAAAYSEFAAGVSTARYGQAVSASDQVARWFYGQPAKGTWTVEYGDSASSTGTIANIMVRLFPQAAAGDKRQDVRAWFSLQSQVDIPDNATLFYPVYFYNSGQQKNLAATVTYAHSVKNEVNVVLMDPVGKSWPMKRSERGDGFTFQASSGLSGPVGGTWFFVVTDSSNGDTGKLTGMSLELNAELVRGQLASAGGNPSPEAAQPQVTLPAAKPEPRPEPRPQPRPEPEGPKLASGQSCTGRYRIYEGTYRRGRRFETSTAMYNTMFAPESSLSVLYTIDERYIVCGYVEGSTLYIYKM